MGTPLAMKYNLGTSVPQSGLSGVAKNSPDEAAVGRWWHPSSPLLPLFALAAITFALIATSVAGADASAAGRLGPLHASGEVGAGKSKPKES